MDSTRHRKLIAGYADLVARAQGVLADSLEPQGPDAQSAIEELIELLNGPAWRELEAARREMAVRPPSPSSIRA